MVEIISLGCGGGRYQTLDQTFRTGGFRVHGEAKVHVDPGPGALLLTNQLGLNPMDLDGVIVSHSHHDHYADAEVLLDAMYRGKSSGGVFVGSKSAIEGENEHGPSVSEYHRKKAKKLVSLEPGERTDIIHLQIEATPTEHTDSTAIGVKIGTNSGVVGYTGDTGYFDGLPGFFEDARILIANVTRPRGKGISGHLCSEDLVEILRHVKPELSIILHMGMLFLRNPPKEEAGYIEEETGVQTIPGFVGMKVRMDEKVKIIRRAKPDLCKFS